MDKRSIILVVSLLALVVSGMFIFAYLKKGEVVEAPLVVNNEEEAVPYSDIKRIDAKHYFIDGVHTFVGELAMPTPCDLVETNSTVMESFPEQVRLNFDVINNAELCAQIITTQRFMISATASTDAKFAAYFMGRVVELNLIPAAPGESPEEFELYIKG